MYNLEITKDFYIIYYNNKKLCKISKCNDLNVILKFFNIQDYKIN